MIVWVKFTEYGIASPELELDCRLVVSLDT
jgi:hypothetical protein